MVTRDISSNIRMDQTLAFDALLTIAYNTPNADASNHNERVNIHRIIFIAWYYQDETKKSS